MAEHKLGWVDMIVFVTERRDLLVDHLRAEDCVEERGRIEGALAELDWLMEQLIEMRQAWAARQKSK